jgi:HK97 family phage portal protein
MGVIDRISKWLSKGAAPSGIPAGAGDAPRTDLWKTQRAPSQDDLLTQYKADVYTCANLNAHVFASQRLRLYALTAPGQETTKRWRTRSVTGAELKRFRETHKNSRAVTQAEAVEELVDHPALRVLERPNPHMDLFMLLELTDLYCEVIGRAYWYKQRGADGVVESIWLVPPTEISAVKDRLGFVEYYNMGASKTRIEVADVVMFAFPSLTAPYTDGRSPLQAGWDAASLEDKRDSYNHATLDNKAMPATLISPKESIGRIEADRLEKRWSRKFRKGGNNGVIVAESALDIKALVQTNKDLEMYQMSALSKEEIANVYGVPVSLIKTADVNRANADAGHYQHARMAIKPRCMRFTSRLNLGYASDFDERLFFGFDDPVPKDAEAEALRRKTDLDSGVTVINEERADEGLPPVDWGDRPWLPFTVAQPDVGGNTQSERTPDPEPKDDDEDDEKEKPPGKDDKEKALAAFDALTAYWAKEAGPQETAERLVDLGLTVPQVKRAMTSHTLRDELQDCSHAEKAPKGAGPLPKGERIAEILRSTFRQQRAEVLRRVRKDVADGAVQKGPLPRAGWTDLTSYRKEMSRKANPVVAMYYDQGAKQLRSKLNVQGDDWNIANPQARRAYERATMEFCDETNRATSMQLDDALARLRQDLADGTASTENTVAELTKRVNAVFDNAEKYRAKRIAVTESSRAVHQGEVLWAEQSGLKLRMRVLLSTDACPLCEEAAAQNVDGVEPGGELMNDGGDGPYSSVTSVPLHPNCQCSQTWEIVGEKPGKNEEQE